MKKIGLIGGMSWESSLVYYQYLNQRTKEILGGFHSCKCVMESLDFAEIEFLQNQDDWRSLGITMADAAENLERAGAELILLCTNTMHLCENDIKEVVNIPFIHIAEATGMAIQQQGLKKVLLLGTKFTMEKDFYKKTLKEKFDIETIVPTAEDRLKIHNIIYQELVMGNIKESSKNMYKEIINKGIDKRARGVILGCTEIPLLIKEQDVSVPTFNTTEIHAEYALQLALK
jgi:aspartate racemase